MVFSVRYKAGAATVATVNVPPTDSSTPQIVSYV
jgi:hypothetical protein